MILNKKDTRIVTECFSIDIQNHLDITGKLVLGGRRPFILRRKSRSL